jgi:murein DD-endopeptidase
MKRRFTAHGGYALIVGMMFALAAVAADAQQVGHAPMEILVPAPPIAVEALGRVHLVWEAHVTNFGVSPLRLERLDVSDAAGQILGTWTGAPLRQRFSVVSQPDASAGGPVTLPAGARAIAFLWVTLETGRSTPDALVHQITVRAADGSDHLTATTPLALRASAPARLAAPVRGGPWVAVRGPSPASGHRLSLVASAGTVRVPQRFAVDWARLGDDGRLYRATGTNVTDWFSYDEPVMAVADGTVTVIRDGRADTAPRSATPAIIDAIDAPGNIVVIDIGDGRFATYAHLRAGSIVVAPGDRVRAGQTLARIGNSGNTLGPHLHFHVSDAAEPLAGEGLPFTLDYFDLLGRVPGLGPMLAGTPWTPQAHQPGRGVSIEMPMENMVVRFTN